MSEEKIFSSKEIEGAQKTPKTRKKKLPSEYECIREFVNWYESEVTTKKDKDVDFVEIGYRAYAKFFKILQGNFEIAKVIEHSVTRFPMKRMYNWLDEDGGWNGVNYIEMAQIRKKFLERENQLNMFGDYSLEELGMYGGGVKKENIFANQYLSYAYYEKIYWDSVVKDMKEKILNLYRKK